MEEIMLLREEVKTMIDKADEKTIRMMYAMLEVEADNDWWETMPDSVKAEVEESIAQADRNEGISHDKAIQKLKKWDAK